MGRTRTTTRWVLEAVAYVSITAVISITEPDLTTILDVISTLFATLQVALLPAVLVYYLYAPMRSSAPSTHQAATTRARTDSKLIHPDSSDQPTFVADALLINVSSTPTTADDTAASLNSPLLVPTRTEGEGSAPSYFAKQAATMDSSQLRGLPHIGQGCAAAISALYAGVALVAAVMYYATIGVQPART